MHHKPFGGRVPPETAGGAYSDPPDLQAGLRGWGPGKGDGRREGVRKGERGKGRGNWDG